jgi:hypothetical protein
MRVILKTRFVLTIDLALIVRLGYNLFQVIYKGWK